jgi:hypothetical protein
MPSEDSCSLGTDLRAAIQTTRFGGPLHLA